MTLTRLSVPLIPNTLAVPDSLALTDFEDILHAVLGCDSGIGYVFQIHGQEFNSFRRWYPQFRAQQKAAA